MRRLSFALISVSTIGFFVACSSGSSTLAPTDDAGVDAATNNGGGDDAGTVKGGQSLTLTASPASTFVVAGSTTTITITRAGSSGTAVSLAVTGLPAGVTAAPATIAATQMSTTLTLSAAANASPAAPATITVSGTTPTISANATFKLAVHGASGTLDTSWGTAGVTKGLGEIGTQATGIAFQKNGLPVVGGYVGSQYAVVRYTNAGLLDTTFGTAGKTYFGGSTTIADVLVIDSSDRIYQAGDKQTVRYTPSGSADATWGTGGTSVRDGALSVGAISLDSSGRLMLGGVSKLNIGGIYRCAADGSPDATWGMMDGNGDYLVGLNVNTTKYAPLALAIQSGGRIVAVGQEQTAGGPSTKAFVTAATSTGSKDTNFGTSGLTLTANEQWLALALQKDDAILAAGYELPTNGSKFSVARYTAGGAVDLSFNGTGIATFTLGDGGTSSQVNGVALQGDGKIVLAGNAVSNGRSVMAVVRIDSKGALDTTFGPSGGIILLPVATTTAGANAVAIGPDGMIYVVGHGDNDFAVARFWP